MNETHDPNDYVDESIETIIERLEIGEVSLAEAERLRSEGKARIEALRDRLDVGEETFATLE